MRSLFSDQFRLLILVVACALLWSLESFIPLTGFAKGRLDGFDEARMQTVTALLRLPFVNES